VASTIAAFAVQLNLNNILRSKEGLYKLSNKHTRIMSELGFLSFPSNLIHPSPNPLRIEWQNQDTYVNISLAHFTFYGGGDEIVEYLTCKTSLLSRSLDSH
jgi:hypothetical protein